MSKIHVLTGNSSNVYSAIVHIAVPVGNNAAGTLWSDAVKNSGLNTSVMIEGTGPGQISTAELASIQNGTIIEGIFSWQDDPTWDNTTRIADLDLRASQLTTELLNRYAASLRYFGFVRT